MKKFTKILAFTLVAAMLCIALASCGGISGKYEASEWGTGISLEFKGNKVTAVFTVVTVELSPVKGTYKIDGDKITFDFTNDEYDSDVNEWLEKFQGELSFEKGEDYIKIGGVKYKSVKD